MNQTSELLFYFVCMESFRYTQAVSYTHLTLPTNSRV